jgi:signal transduction histidine kinase
LLAEDVRDKPLEYRWFSDMPVDEYKSLVRKVLATGEPVQISGIWTQPEHAGEHYAAHLVAERDSEGSIVSALAISRNVTEAKKAELELEESRCLIRQLAGRSEAVREEERKHMARELHDGLAQGLLALRLKIGLLSLEFGAKAPEIDTRVESMVCLVDDAIKVVRDAITSLRPVTLDLGMLPALEWLVEQFSADTGIPCEFRSDLPSVSLSEKHTMAMFRVAQEALRNIFRHAAASRARLSLVSEGDFYLLEISDDGRGFDPSKINPKSFGLLGIKERVSMFSGTYQLETAPGKGTVIRIRIPRVAPSIQS